MISTWQNPEFYESFVDYLVFYLRHQLSGIRSPVAVSSQTPRHKLSSSPQTRPHLRPNQPYSRDKSGHDLTTHVAAQEPLLQLEH